MKLDKNVLIEIVSIVQEGLMEQKDISDGLRNLDLENREEGFLGLSDSYYSDKGRDNPYLEAE